MSRIGKQPISLAKGVTFNFSKENHTVTVKGPKGELKQVIDSDFTVKQEEGSVVVERPTEQKRHKAMHGLYRALIANMVEGVSNGYKANAQSNVLELSLGYSHNVFLAVPSEIKVTATQEKGGNPTIVLEGIDKQLIGQVAAKIKSLRQVEPYKGKGIRFTGEYVRRKAGKAAAK